MKIQKKTALPTSDNPRTAKLPRLRDQPPRLKSCKAVESTRVEGVWEYIRPPIQKERRKQKPSTHRYPTRFKALAVPGQHTINTYAQQGVYFLINIYIQVHQCHPEPHHRKHDRIQAPHCRPEHKKGSERLAPKEFGRLANFM